MKKSPPISSDERQVGPLEKQASQVHVTSTISMISDGAGSEHSPHLLPQASGTSHRRSRRRVQQAPQSCTRSSRASPSLLSQRGCKVHWVPGLERRSQSLSIALTWVCAGLAAQAIAERPHLITHEPQLSYHRTCLLTQNNELL